MSDAEPRSHEESIFVESSPQVLYDLVSDVTRTGEWSPVCTGCWWDDNDRSGQVGTWFTGRNEVPGRTWETRSQVEVAQRGREFAWVVGGSFVRWGFVLTPVDAGTRLTETWHFLDGGIEMFHEKYAEQADAEIAERTRHALAGIPTTLAAIKRIAESASSAGTS